MVTDTTTILLTEGELRLRGWPSDVVPPFGLVAAGAELRGPARLRRRARHALVASARPFCDSITPSPLAPDECPPTPLPPPSTLATWLASDSEGLVASLPERERIDLVLAAAHQTKARTLLVVRDSGAETVWRRALRERGFSTMTNDEGACALAITSAGDAAHSMHWRAHRHDLLVVDRPEQMPAPTVHAVLDGSAALHRLGLVDAHGLARVGEWSAGLGTLLAVAAVDSSPRRLHLHLPLSTTERADYETAWHTFLCAFDAFAAAQPNAGFGTFIQQARRDDSQRPALFAWHRALRVASYNAAKAAACAELIERHRGQRLLLFAPDRASTYELSRAHLIAPVTAELPRRERTDTLTAFATGRLRALVGPRLLDLGVSEGSADVGILIGGGFGEAQQAARVRRIATTGIVYQLVAQDTVEVGRAHRFARTPAAASTDVHPRR